MKTFKVTIALSHESFGGYDHSDGNVIKTVKAKNQKSAESKAIKEVGGGYEKRVISITEI